MDYVYNWLRKFILSTPSLTIPTHALQPRYPSNADTVWFS